MNIYEFFRECEQNGIPAEDAMDEWNDYQREAAEYEAERLEELEERSLMTAWQQDLIDLHRMER